jgi:pantoate--beta-alanine ligase
MNAPTSTGSPSPVRPPVEQIMVPGSVSERLAVATTRAELAAARDSWSGRVGAVFTMGALHDGHAALIRAARAEADRVLVTVFVNPLQFGPTEDFDRYPRTLDADLALCRQAGADLVFAPEQAQMYPAGPPAVRVDPGRLGARLEGTSRPGFFQGALTAVLKLLHLTRPDLTFFGEKDYQQLTLVRAMVTDTDLPVQVIGVPTVREPDGLARSSRNRYLNAAERRAALSLSAALSAGAQAAAQVGSAAAVPAAQARFDQWVATIGDVASRLDYLVLTDPMLGPAPAHGPARLLIAAAIGQTRLIDNLPVEVR